MIRNSIGALLIMIYLVTNKGLYSMITRYSLVALVIIPFLVGVVGAPIPILSKRSKFEKGRKGKRKKMAWKNTK